VGGEDPTYNVRLARRKEKQRGLWYRQDVLDPNLKYELALGASHKEACSTGMSPMKTALRGTEAEVDRRVIQFKDG